MASHHDTEAFERKLRPVYDALDARSWKQAAKLADAVLKKYKNDQLVRALKGYALHRSGKGEEALQLMREIVAEGPLSERVVMTMTYTLKAAGDIAGITQAYLAAAERLPKDPEVLAGLFKAHVREFDFVRQQQAAAKLSKLAAPGSEAAARAAWWIVCSLALQARGAGLARAGLLRQDARGAPLAPGAAGLPPEKLLQLAESMAARQAAVVTAAAAAGGQGSDASAAAKAAAAKAGWSYEALLLHLDILQGQGKAQEALQVLEGPLGDAVPLPPDRLQLRAAALARAGDLPAAAACYREALAAAPDDWTSWQLLLDCLLPGSGSGASGSSSGGASGSRFPVGIVGGLADIWDRRQAAAAAAPAAGLDVGAGVAAAEAAIEQLGAEVAANDSWRAAAERGTLRAPHLWRCELLLRRLRLAAAGGSGAAAAAPAQEELAEAVGEAFAKLAGNFSCVADLRPYLAQLSGPAAERLAAEAHRRAAELNAAEPAAEPAAAAAAGAPEANGGNAENGSSGGGGGGGGSTSGEVRRLQRLVNAHAVESELGLPLYASAGEAATHAGRLLGLYRQHLHLSAKLDEKERGYGEELVALAAEALLRGAAAAGPEAAATELPAAQLAAALVLEAAQRRRKVSAPLRLAATALYSLLGASGLACAQFAALDVKSVLHDSLTGHWLLPLASAQGAAAPELRRWADGCAALHELHQQEAGETLGTALQHGTYSKVPEFVDFKERLQHSHARALAAALQALLPEAEAAAGAGGAKAAAAAPLSSLYSVGSSEARRAALQQAAQLLAAAEGAAAAAVEGPRVRFNDDLSTRPAWYPPGSASGSAVADWWRLQQAQQGQQQQGYARCWWARPGAAESAAPEAEAWRQRCLAELRVRVAWALIASAPLASAADADALLQQVQPLLAAPAGQAAGEGAALQVAACRAVAALLAALAPGSDAAAADLAPVQELAAACGAAAKRLSADLAAVQGLALLPGGPITAATACTADCRSVAAVSARLKKLASKAAAVAAAAAAAADAAAAAAAELRDAAKAAAAAQEEGDRVAAALAAAERYCSSGSSSSSRSSGRGGQESSTPSPLWGFEPDFEARPAVEALVKAQLQALRAV